MSEVGPGVPSHTPAPAGGPGYPPTHADSGHWHPARGLGVCVCVCVCMRICTSQGVFMCVGMYMCTCVHVHVCEGHWAYV